MTRSNPRPETRTLKLSRGIPLPHDAPLMTLGEAGAYLRLSTASIRKLIDGRADAKDDALGERLRGWVVRLSPHRRYIQREPFMTWLREISDPGLSEAS